MLVSRTGAPLHWKPLEPDDSEPEYYMNGLGNNFYVWDLDKDGIDDLMYIALSTSFLKGLPEGGFDTGIMRLDEAPDFSPSPGCHILIGNGDGTFYKSQSISYIQSTPGYIDFFRVGNITIGDANGDGFDDLWFGNENLLWINQYQQDSHVEFWDTFK